MQDRPTVLELLTAVRELLANEIVPALADPRLRYHALIAVHVLRILEREIPGEDARLAAELAALTELCDLPRDVRSSAPGRAEPPRGEACASLEDAPPAIADLRRRVLEANRELCERIRRGLADDDPWRERVLAHVRAVVETKLRIDNPGELGDPPSSGRK